MRNLANKSANKHDLNMGAFGRRRVAVASEARSTGVNGERLVGRNGELNASSKLDLIEQTGRLMQVANTHQLVTQSDAERIEIETAKLLRRETAVAMFNDPEKLKAVGAAMGDELYITQGREGIMRNVLQRQELENGRTPRVALRTRNLTVGVVSGPTATELQVVRDNFLYPVEYYLTARPYVEQKEIVQNSTDVLEDKYMEAMTAFMVQEDRLFRQLCINSIGHANPLTTHVGLMNPIVLGNFRNRIESWNITAQQWLIANDLWTDIVGDTGFQSIYEPMAQHEILLTGKLGTILGMTVKSDGFRHPEHRVLEKGEQFIFGPAETLGTYTDRGGIDVTPIDAAITSIPGRGWNMYAMQSQTLANFRAVACGRRVN